MMSDSSARSGNLRIQITIVITAVYVNMTLLSVVFMVHCLDMGHGAILMGPLAFGTASRFLGSGPPTTHHRTVCRLSQRCIKTRLGGTKGEKEKCDTPFSRSFQQIPVLFYALWCDTYMTPLFGSTTTQQTKSSWASHRIASHRIASHRIASHRIYHTVQDNHWRR